MKKIYVFTLPNCKRCVDLMEFMTEESIPFTEIPIHDNRSIWEEIRRQSPGFNLICPTFFVQDSSDGSGYIYSPIRDFKTDNEILTILKNNI